jgi:hypothetical protein
MVILTSIIQSAQTRTKQATGTNEEVDRHILLMDDILLRYESVSQNKEVKLAAQRQLEKKRVQGDAICVASTSGLTRKRDLEDVEETGGRGTETDEGG